MRLPDGFRQVLAGLLAAAAFLGLYFGLTLVWWAALGLAVAVYFALLLVIGRRTPLDEIMLTGRVSAADVKEAGRLLFDAAHRLDAVSGHVPEADRTPVVSMATHLRSLRQNVLSDPEDYRSTRRFVLNFVPIIVETVESYAELARRSGPEHSGRLEEMGRNIRGLEPVVRQIDQATLDNDFNALEVQLSALATQINRGYVRK